MYSHIQGHNTWTGSPMAAKSQSELEQTIEYIKTNLGSFSRAEREKALEVLQNYNVTKARDNFYVYVCLMAETFLGTDFEDGPHIRYLCETLQSMEQGVVDGKPKRVQISMPPRSMKTVLSNLFVSWLFGRHPEWKILHISHTQSLIEDVSGRPIRDLMKTFEYSRIFPRTQLKKDSRSAKRWETTANGIYFCAGVDGKIAGRGANIVIGDDMMADHAAKSKAERERINRNYVPMARSRLWRYGSELMIGTRWHVDDLLGFLQKLDGTTDRPVPGSTRPWEIVSIPAIIDEKASKLLGLPVGSSYWPDTKPLDEIKDLERSNSTEDWNAIYLQRPVIEEGNIFKKSDFKVWDHSEPPSNIKFILVSMDTAFSTKESADFSAFTVWGIFERNEVVKFGINLGREITVNHLCLLEAHQGRWNFTDLFDKIEEIREAYDPDIFVVENKGSGQTVIQELLRRGWPVHGYNPTVDKITRAHAVTPILRSGRVHIPNKWFAKELINECLAFPNYSSDDMTDSMTMCLLYLRDTFDMSSNKWAGEIEEDLDAKPKYSTGKATYWSLVTGNV